MNTMRSLIKLLGAAMLAISSMSASAGTLSNLPLSLKSGVPPNIMFALSVEFPTAITPAYQDTASYSRNNSYLGYFDNAKCYYYSSSLNSGSVTGWFYPYGLSSSTENGSPHACTSGWSGNFLNWVSMAGLDEFRFAMTGGNRVVDLANSTTYPGGLTVLQRSYQTSQGSNFITKTFTEDGYSTAYATGTALTIVNKGNGVNMVVTTSGTVAGTATCNSPTNTGSGITCASYTLSNGDSTTCSTYTGSGTSASPYTCTAFNTSTAGTAINSPAATISTTLVNSGVSGTATISCPANSFSTNPPSCTATLSNGSTGSCASWNAGPGTSSGPYACTGFNTFSGQEAFSFTSTSGSSTATGTTSAPYTNSSVTCSVSGSSPTTTCSSLDGNNTTATCSSYTSTGGGSSKRYYCTSFALNGSDTFVSASNPSNSYTTVSTKKYYDTYTIINNVSTSTSNYYTPTYTGSYGTATYYSNVYNVSIGSGSATYPVRAQVCNNAVGLESDCQSYTDTSGNVTYKPAGVLQSNGNTMRFGVSSYFNANDIDNAVLRSKAKYLAPDQVLVGGSIQSNSVKEWSATDGTFISNPDSTDTATMTTPWGTAPANSGVINYINKFGTVAQGYKTYDDIGKLYYETLRYLRGGQGLGGMPSPTTAFYNGAKSSNNDGFPVITSWDDPVKYSCQKNYIITMGDAHTWCDKRLPGGTYTSNGSTVCNAYTDGNGNSHPSDLGSLSGDTGITGTINGTTVTSTANATDAVGSMEGMGAIATTQTGAGGASYYIAGLAAWAATNNIRPDLASNTSPMNVKSFIIDVQEAQDCSYRKQFWLAAKYGDPSYYTYSTGGASTWNSSAPWFNPILGNSFTCASNGPPNYGSSTASMNWPKNLLRAGDPASMINSVKSAIQTIAAEQGAESALSQSAGALNTGTGAYIYQGTYNSGGWTGDLKAFVIDTTGTASTTPDWMASQHLPNPSARNIFSFSRGTATGDTNHFTGIQFAPDSSSGLSYFDTYQQNLLNTSNLGTVDSFGVDRVKYIRGDMSNETYLPSATGASVANTLANHGWRSRLAEGVATSYTTASYTNGPTGQLGDIIDSNPVYVGPPLQPLPDASYKAFAVAHASRTPMVYVGSNDGMLHAFNASYTVNSSGLPAHTTSSAAEVFAYVPYAAYPTLNNLMSTNYAHTFYVDGSPVSADACMNSTHTACNGTGDTWKTILTGSMNAGGKGIYALDITDPVTSFGTANILWEFTSLDDADLGYTFSQPVVAKLNNGRWAVIFGNGFNSVDATGNPGNNKAYLFIAYIDPALSSTQSWVLNTNYFKIPLTSPGAPNNASNGLAGITTVDANQNGKVDFVYAGDRNGNLWKIDLTSSTPASWAASFSGQPLFSAKDSSGNRQQITTTPKVGSNPYGGFIVNFGTGSWIDTSDTSPQSGSTFNTDTLYGIWDQNNGATSSPATGRSVLQRQAIIGSYSVDTTGTTCSTGANCTTYTVQSSCEPNYTTTALADPGNGLTGNQTTLCPQYVPAAPAYTTYSSTLLASITGTTQQFGWYFDLPGNGERTHSNPPALIGSNIQFTSLTPSTNPCTGNTLGVEYDFSYLKGGAPSPIYILPGTTSLADAGQVYLTLPGSSTQVKVVLSGKTLSGGAAQNPITFNASTQAAQTGGATIPVPAGMPGSAPAFCTAGNCTAANYYIPGWGFLMNMGAGPASSSGRVSISCTNTETGGMVCTPRLRPGQFGRLSWKQIN